MPRAKTLPMPQEVANKTAHLAVRISPTERDLMRQAMTHAGLSSVSDFVRQAIVALSEAYLQGESAHERHAAIEDEHARLYSSEPPPFTQTPPTFSDVLGVPLFSPGAGSTVGAVEAVGLDDDMGDWL